MLFLISSYELNILFVVKTIGPSGLALEFVCSLVAPKWYDVESILEYVTSSLVIKPQAKLPNHFTPRDFLKRKNGFTHSTNQNYNIIMGGIMSGGY